MYHSMLLKFDTMIPVSSFARGGDGDTDIGALLTCTGASCWPYIALAYRVRHVMGRATGNRFSFSYSESGV